MMNNRLVVLLLVSLMLAGCAYNYPKDDPSWRDAPPPVTVNLPEGCASINGVYESAGTTLRGNNGVDILLLAETVFRKFLLKDGTHIFSERVRISNDPVEMKLHLIVMGAGAVQEWSASYECNKGWIHVRDYKGKQRTTSMWITRLRTNSDVLLAHDPNGNLVVHSILEFEEKTFLAFKEKARMENWYLFKRLANE